MKQIFLGILGASVLAVTTVHGQGTAFHYQGRLSTVDGPANGLYDFSFNLHDIGAGGSALTTSNGVFAVPVTGGLFVVSLDFGNQFNGADRWLGIAVRTNGVGAFTTLNPRQKLAPTPYAIRAASAGTATTASGVSAGAINTAALSANAVDSSKVLDGTITANDLSPALLNTTFWRSLGNAGTTPGTHFIGTTDGQPIRIQAPQVGINTATPRGPLEVNTGAGSLIFRNEGGLAPGLVVSNAPAEGVLRFRHRLEIWPNPSATDFGSLDIRETNGNAAVRLPARGSGFFTAGNFGFGTTTPGSSVEVNGGIRARGGAPGGFGAANNGYAFNGNGGDTDSGMFSSADGQVEFYANATERMRIQGSGNVGIGHANPAARLQVASNGGDGNPQLWIDQSNLADYSRLRLTLGGDYAKRWDVGSRNDAFVLYSGHYGREMLRVDAAGVNAVSGLVIENRTSDPPAPVSGQIWLRTDLP